MLNNLSTLFRQKIIVICSLLSAKGQVNLFCVLSCTPLSHIKGHITFAKMIEKQCTLAILCSFLLFSAPVFGMHVESYWESWVLKDYPNDWCALLEEVPASPIGSTEGANYVSIGIKNSI